MHTTYTYKPTHTVALMPIGFGDGLSRKLSNKGSVLIRGKRAPIVGRVCMDQCIVDVNSINYVVLVAGFRPSATGVSQRRKGCRGANAVGRKISVTLRLIDWLRLYVDDHVLGTWYFGQ